MSGWHRSKRIFGSWRRAWNAVRKLHVKNAPSLLQISKEMEKNEMNGSVQGWELWACLCYGTEKKLGTFGKHEDFRPSAFLWRLRKRGLRLARCSGGIMRTPRTDSVSLWENLVFLHSIPLAALALGPLASPPNSPLPESLCDLSPHLVIQLNSTLIAKTYRFRPHAAVDERAGRRSPGRGREGPPRSGEVPAACVRCRAGGGHRSTDCLSGAGSRTLLSRTSPSDEGGRTP